MLTFVRGNLFESPAQALVNTVNTEGVMGKGIALEFKKIFPEMFEEYRAMCEAGRLKVGQLHIWRAPQRIIVNFPTKTTWRKPSHADYIRSGLATFVTHYQQLGITSVAFPPLGCGNGELKFEKQVKPLMVEYLSAVDIPVYVYAPLPREQVAEHRMPEQLREWLRSAPQDMPFGEVWHDLIELLRHAPEITTFAQGVRLDAKIDDENGILGIRWNGGEVQLPKIEVREVWSRLRMHGMLRTSMVTGPNVSLVFPILAALPYVAGVKLAGTVEGLEEDKSWGIQLVPAEAEAQRGFALAK